MKGKPPKSPLLSWKELSHLEVSVWLLMLAQESPQVVALALSQLPSKVSGEICSALRPEALRTEVLLRLARMEPPDLRVLEDLRAHFSERGAAVQVHLSAKVGGSGLLVRWLAGLDEVARAAELEALKSRDPRLAAELTEALEKVSNPAPKTRS